MKAGGGLANMDEAAMNTMQRRSASDLEGGPVANWTTDLRLITWAEPAPSVYKGTAGRLIGRVYGGFAFSRFS